MAAKTQAFGVIHVHALDSRGMRGRPVNMNERLMVRNSDGSMWYGFVITEMESQVICAGGEARVGMAFLDDQGARSEIRMLTPFLFGNGVSTRGTITVDEYV